MITRRPSGRVPFSGGAANSLPPLARRALAPFGGLVTSVDASLLADGSPFNQNADVEDGAISWRLGYRSHIGSVTDQSSNKLFAYFSTYTTAGVFMDGFLSADLIDPATTLSLYEINRDGTTDLYSRHAITIGATATALNNSFWRTVAFRDKVYIFNRDSQENSGDPSPLLMYTPGTYNSLAAVKRPTAPTGVPAINYAKNSSGGAAYNRVRWTGLDVATEVAYTSPAQATSSSLSGEAFSIAHASSTLGKAKVKIDLSAITAGNQDLQRSDNLTFTLTLPNPNDLQIVASSIKFYPENAGGTETELKVTAIPFTNGDGKTTRIECYAEFQDKSRSTWASVKYFSLEYDVSVSSGTAANNLLRFDPVLKGGITDWYGDNVDAPADAAIAIQYSWANTTTGYESGLSSGVTLSRTNLLGAKWEFATGLYLGSMPIVNTAASAESGVDRVRIYMSRSKSATGTGFGKARRLVDQVDTDTTYDLTTTAAEFEALLEYDPAPFRHDDIVCAAVFGQFVVWGYLGGEQNVRYSRVGEALLQADPDDVLISTGNTDDLGRGATFSLTDDHTDSPQGFVGCGDALVILGSDGIYASLNTNGLPSGMTPPRRIPGAPGTIGYESFCKGADSQGNPGVYYVSADGGSIWFVQVFQGFDGSQGFRLIEVSKAIRGPAFETMLYGSSVLTNPERVMVFIDPVTTHLWVFYNSRAIVLLRPDPISDKRKWVFRDYEEGQYGSSWIKVVQAGKRGVYGMRLNGAMDEFERANVVQSVGTDRSLVPLDARAFTPSSTDTGTERLTFTTAPGWTNGWGVTFSLTGGGFTAGTTYYARRITTGYIYEFYDTAANARATGGTTGRVNITATITASIRPIGQDDGSVPPACKWRSATFTAIRRRAFRAKIERDSLTDRPTLTAVFDRASQSVQVASGEKYVRFGHSVSGQKGYYEIELPALCGSVNQIEIEEAALDGSKQR